MNLTIRTAALLADLLEPDPQPLGALCRKHGLDAERVKNRLMRDHADWFEMTRAPVPHAASALHVSLTQAGRQAVVDMLEPLQFGSGS